MNTPRSTYRIQFNHEFTFGDLQKRLEYLERLGISTVYASPIFQSVPGSLHGYDVTDPDRINPEIGTEEELEELAIEMRRRGMSWLQDIVPNHMSLSKHNTRLMDVLERGCNSEYYRFFDIRWDHPNRQLYKKLMLAVLPEAGRDNLSARLTFTTGGFLISGKGFDFPVSSKTFDFLMLNADDPDTKQDLETLQPDPAGPMRMDAWQRIKDSHCNRIWKDSASQKRMRRLCKKINSSPDGLHALFELQNFRLVPWSLTSKEINYRRFFTINDLICVRMEDAQVFQDYHRYLKSLYNRELIQGLRVDHIDGLYDPEGYCTSLRKLVGGQCYIVAEKILGQNEELPSAWPIGGTSGYEFLAEINQLFTDGRGAAQLRNFYRSMVPDQVPYDALVRKNKQLILSSQMNGEWENLTDLIFLLKLDNGFQRGILKEAIGFLLVSFPVYRLYSVQTQQDDNEVIFDLAFKGAREAHPSAAAGIDHLKSLLETGKYPKADVSKFYNRLMQFTGPLTAKGVEDTTFYSYNSLISHDEVGDTPARWTLNARQFHEKMLRKREATPLSLNTLSTHDTKRGEDARLRLNVLSEMPDRWQELVLEWMAYDEQFAADSLPTWNDRYFIYQSVIGGIPPDLKITNEWITRFKGAIEKALREGKVNSGWTKPNEKYEQACFAYVDRLFHPQSTFLTSLRPFQHQIDNFAMTYSLAAVLLKITAPGIPDLYQGSELFNYSFVDPDNRRAVDFDLRSDLLQTVIRQSDGETKDILPALRERRAEGMEKLFVTWKTLNFRRVLPDLFVKGKYVPLNFTHSSMNTLAFARVFEDHWAIVAVPLNLAASERGPKLQKERSRLLLPEGVHLPLTNQFTGDTIGSGDDLTLDRLFGDFPVTLLYGKFENKSTSV